MFDIDLYQRTKIDLMIVDFNGNGLANYFVKTVKGDKSEIAKVLVGDLFLDEVLLDKNKKDISVITYNGFEYVCETIHIISGIDSLEYHGKETPLLHPRVEWFYLDKTANTIKIMRLISSFINKSETIYKNYFDSINSYLDKWIEDLNFAVRYHNQMIEDCAAKHAEWLNYLYLNYPEMLR